MKSLLIFLITLPVLAQEFAEPSLVSPFSGEEYEQMIVSETYYNGRFRNNHYYRYITLYNVAVEREEMQDVPRIMEYCHESGNRVANWAVRRSYSRDISSSFGFNVLGIDVGLGADVSRRFEFSFQRWIQAVAGVKAVHIPVMSYEVLEGVTYMQTYYPNTGNTVNTRLNKEKFFVNYVNPMFEIEREVLVECEY